MPTFGTGSGINIINDDFKQQHGFCGFFFSEQWGFDVIQSSFPPRLALKHSGGSHRVGFLLKFEGPRCLHVKEMDFWIRCFKYFLVGGLEHVFSHILGIIIPFD